MLRWLSEVTLAAAPSVGMKAARLGELIAAGLPVPRGFVLGHELFDANGGFTTSIREGLAALGDVPLTVRPSVIDDESAGLYASVLEVRGEDSVLAAIGRVQMSARSFRALAHRGSRGPAKMAVIVQQMVRVDTAGVTFTADPATGDRDRRVISVVRRLGEARESDVEEWVIEKGRAQRRRSIAPTLQERRVIEIGRVAKQVAERLDAPQEIEWAIDKGGGLTIVQTRPIGALPDHIEWTASGGGAWMRNIHYGEWLTLPVSPLFASWFRVRADAAFERARRAQRVHHVLPVMSRLVNGWSYQRQTPTDAPGFLATLRAPRAVLALKRIATDPHTAAKRVVDPLHKEYVARLRPAHQALATRAVPSDRASAIAFLDELADLHGELMFSMAAVGGFAWQVESLLARFVRTHLPDIEDSPHWLLVGLSGPFEPAPHLVGSIDWMHPTLGELGDVPAPLQRDAAELREFRESFELECREAIADRPKLLAQFDALVRLARAWAAHREQQAADFTLAWPLARAALRVIGEELVARGVIAAPGDVHFLERSELDATEPLHAIVEQRRTRWQRQCRLAAPLTLSPGALGQSQLRFADDVAGTIVELAEDRLVGMPISPGRVEGTVRIIRSMGELSRFRDGEVLVAPATPPGWTPLVARASAVVTDGGSLAAHTSLIAREVGIPAVAATHDATQRLHDGQLVAVDGSLGIVEILDQ